MPAERLPADRGERVATFRGYLGPHWWRSTRTGELQVVLTVPHTERDRALELDEAMGYELTVAVWARAQAPLDPELAELLGIELED